MLLWIKPSAKFLYVFFSPTVTQVYSWGSDKFAQLGRMNTLNIVPNLTKVNLCLLGYTVIFFINCPISLNKLILGSVSLSLLMMLGFWWNPCMGHGSGVHPQFAAGWWRLLPAHTVLHWRAGDVERWQLSSFLWHIYPDAHPFTFQHEGLCRIFFILKWKLVVRNIFIN